MNPHHFLNRLSAALFVVAITGGCAAPMSNEAKFRMKTLDDSKLYWCINEINVGHIRRGMSKDSLKSLFGESLYFEDKESGAICTLTVPKKTGNAAMQLPAPWMIKFTFDMQGNVDNYVITREAGK